MSGGYDAVRRYAKSWSTRARERCHGGRLMCPLSFAPGEAYQFDWSHEIVVMSGVTTVTLKVAHVRLCHSRMMFAARLSARDPGDCVRRA